MPLQKSLTASLVTSSFYSMLALGRLDVFGDRGDSESGTPELVSAEMLGGADAGGPGWTLTMSSVRRPFRCLSEAWAFMSALLISAHIAPSGKQCQALFHQAEQI